MPNCILFVQFGQVLIVCTYSHLPAFWNNTMTDIIVANDKLAVNKRLALKMFWDAGYNTEELLLKANALIESCKQVTKGYWLADNVSNLIELGV